MSIRTPKLIFLSSLVLFCFTLIPANNASGNELISGPCFPVAGEAEVNLCDDGRNLIYVHEGGFGVEKPEPGFISTVKIFYEGSAWNEFSVSTSKNGGVSFNYDSSLIPDVVLQPVENYSSVGTTNCGSPSYFKKFGWRVNQPHEWWYREFDQADFHSLYRVKNAFRTWEIGANRCNSTIIENSYAQTYMGKTTLSIPYQQNFFLTSTFDDCLNPGPKDMVAWATMPGNVLAGTCSYTPELDFLHWVPARSSIILNTFKTWYTDPSPTGCTLARFDLQAVVTHEVGHTLGLDHFSHVGQAMTPAQGYCATDKRGLGYGDVHGVANIYPPN